MKKNPLEDGNLPDEQVAEELIVECPAELKLAIGQSMRAAIVQAIQRERLRCATLLEQGVRVQTQKLGQTQTAMEIAQRTGNIDGAEQLAAQSFQVMGAITALKAAAAIVQRAPGSCAKCGGAGVLPSSISGRSGQVMAVQCDACAPAAAPAPGATP